MSALSRRIAGTKNVPVTFISSALFHIHCIKADLNGKLVTKRVTYPTPIPAKILGEFPLE